MGVCYSYYDKKRHVEFEMGKWYGWSDEGAAVAKLFLPRELLVAEIAARFDLDEDVGDVEYATWLTDKLIAFRGNGKREDFLWINDSDDSDDVTFRCGLCTRYFEDYAMGGQRPCTCEVSQPCKTVGSRYTGDYDTEGRYVGAEP